MQGSQDRCANSSQRRKASRTLSPRSCSTRRPKHRGCSGTRLASATDRIRRPSHSSCIGRIGRGARSCSSMARAAHRRFLTSAGLAHFRRGSKIRTWVLGLSGDRLLNRERGSSCRARDPEPGALDIARRAASGWPRSRGGRGGRSPAEACRCVSRSSLLGTVPMVKSVVGCRPRASPQRRLHSRPRFPAKIPSQDSRPRLPAKTPGQDSRPRFRAKMSRA
jgi:hypothetical protein